MNQWTKNPVDQSDTEHVAMLDDIRIVCILCVNDASKVIYMKTPNGYRRKKINVCQSCLSALSKVK